MLNKFALLFLFTSCFIHFRLTIAIRALLARRPKKVNFSTLSQKIDFFSKKVNKLTFFIKSQIINFLKISRLFGSPAALDFYCQCRFMKFTARYIKAACIFLLPHNGVTEMILTPIRTRSCNSMSI